MGQFWDRHFRLIAERSGILDLFKGKAAANTEGTARDMVESGTWFVGTPEQVTDQIVEQYRLTGGFGTLLQLGYDYADEDAREGWMRSMELLRRQVLPAVNQKLGFAAH